MRCLGWNYQFLFLFLVSFTSLLKPTISSSCFTSLAFMSLRKYSVGESLFHTHATLSWSNFWTRYWASPSCWFQWVTQGKNIVGFFISSMYITSNQDVEKVSIYCCQSKLRMLARNLYFLSIVGIILVRYTYIDRSIYNFIIQIYKVKQLIFYYNMRFCFFFFFFESSSRDYWVGKIETKVMGEDINSCNHTRC